MIRLAALRLVVAALAAVVPGGCTETRFESAPATSLRDCDPSLKGLWLAEDATDDHPDGILVDARCTLFVVGAESGAPTHTPVAVRFARIDGNDIVVAAEAALAPLVQVPPPHAVEPPPATAFFLARYRVEGDRLEWFPVDSARVAARVIDGSLDGTVSKTENELHVFVRGSGQRMLEMLRHEHIFSAAPAMVLRRSHDAVDAMPPATQPDTPTTRQ
jgi:hypothetical protein